MTSSSTDAAKPSQHTVCGATLRLRGAGAAWCWLGAVLPTQCDSTRHEEGELGAAPALMQPLLSTRVPFAAEPALHTELSADDEGDDVDTEQSKSDAALIMPEMGIMSYAEEGLVYFEDGSYSRGAMSVSEVTPNETMEGQEELTVVFETCLVRSQQQRRVRVFQTLQLVRMSRDDFDGLEADDVPMMTTLLRVSTVSEEWAGPTGSAMAGTAVPDSHPPGEERAVVQVSVGFPRKTTMVGLKGRIDQTRRSVAEKKIVSGGTWGSPQRAAGEWKVFTVQAQPLAKEVRGSESHGLSSGESSTLEVAKLVTADHWKYCRADDGLRKWIRGLLVLAIKGTVPSDANHACDARRSGSTSCQRTHRVRRGHTICRTRRLRQGNSGAARTTATRPTMPVCSACRTVSCRSCAWASRRINLLCKWV